MSSPRLGPFTLLHPLGQGGMGVVWRATHGAEASPVAVKVLTAEAAREPSFHAAFHNEVHAAARLTHPGIVRLLDTGVVDAAAARDSRGVLAVGSPYLAMELLDGGALQPRAYGGTWAEVRDLLLTLLGALAHAHARGVTHRDLKPTNILFAGAEAELPGPRLCDFGLALARREGGAVDPTRSSASAVPTEEFGSVHYMAPEQRREAEAEQGPWTDLYALGVIAWELVTGERPYPGSDLFAVTWAHLRGELPALQPRYPLPPGVEAFLHRMLARSPRDRFQSAAEAALFLRGLQGGHGRGFSALAALPLDWRADQPAPRPLLGAGLGLFGLRSPPLVRREAARDALWQALRGAVESGAPRCVLLHGGPGVGKSRLMRWVGELASELVGAPVLHAELGPALGPSGGLRPMLRRALRCEGLSGEPLLVRLEEEVRALGGTDPFEWRALASVLVHADDPLRSSLPPPSPSELRGAVRRLLARLAANRPVIVALDDLHGDPHSIELLQQLLAAPPRSIGPVLLLATVRDDLLPSLSDVPARLAVLGSLDGLREIVVPPLDDEAMSELVGGLLDLEPSLRRAVVRRADGSPLFAVQLLSEQLGRGLIRPSTDGFVLAGGELALPGDIHALWGERLRAALAGLGEPAMELVWLASTLGAEVERDEWAAAAREAGLDPGLLDPVLARLFGHLLARGAPTRWRFTYDLVREACERAATASGRRAALLAAAGRAVMRRAGSAGAERAGLLLREGGDRIGACDALLAAAEERGRGSDFLRMRELVALAAAEINLLPEEERRPRLAPAHLMAARCAQMLGDLAACERSAHEVLSLPGGPTEVELVEATSLLGSVARLQGRPDEARLLLDEALRSAERVPERVRARILHELAMIDRREGRFGAAGAHYEAAARAYSVAGEPLGAARCQQGLGFIANDLGDSARATAIFEALLPTMARLGDRLAHAATIDGLASAHMAQGRLLSAGVGHLQAWTMMEETRSPVAAISALNYVLVLILQRDFKEAALVLEAIEVAAHQPGFATWLPHWLACHLPCDARRRDGGAFDRHLAALDHAATARPPSPSDVGRVAEVAASLLAESGDLLRAGRAAALADRMWELSGRKPGGGPAGVSAS